MNIDEVRKVAMALPEVTEEPHHHFSSFRVRRKIFATVPPDEQYLHVFVDEQRRELALAMFPDNYEKLWWGKNVAGIRVALRSADADDVADLLKAAWARKAPKSMLPNA